VITLSKLIVACFLASLLFISLMPRYKDFAFLAFFVYGSYHMTIWTKVRLVLLICFNWGQLTDLCMVLGNCRSKQKHLRVPPSSPSKLVYIYIYILLNLLYTFICLTNLKLNLVYEWMNIFYIVQTVRQHVLWGVIYHLIQITAKELVELVVKSETAYHLVLLGTKQCVPAMLA